LVKIQLMKGNRYIFLLLLIFFFSSCNKTSSEINPDDTRLLIENLISKFSTSINNADTAIVSRFAIDSVQLIYPDKRLSAYGIKSLQKFVSNPQWNYVSIKPRQIEVSDNLAYSSSVLMIDVLKRDSPGIVKYKGEILMVFKKEEEFWKLAVVSYNVVPQ